MGEIPDLVLGSFYLLKEELLVTAGVLAKGIRIMIYGSRHEEREARQPQTGEKGKPSPQQ